MEETLEPDTHAKNLQKIQIQQRAFTGGIWIAAWLFTIGFLRLTFWKGVLALVLWPYYIGLHFSAGTR